MDINYIVFFYYLLFAYLSFDIDYLLV